MEKMLLIRVHLIDDRYHGERDWPPSPARLFQALVAANAEGARLSEDCAEALRWLESVPNPPEIRAQCGWPGRRYNLFVPNNDLDAKGGDPRQVSALRVEKPVRPRFVDNREPIVYGWRFDASEDVLRLADRICRMAENLYRLGRGVDAAWATAEVVSMAEGERRLDEVLGESYRPGAGHGVVTLACPQPGSLDSLLSRFKAHRDRFRTGSAGKRATVYFTNPPKPRFHQVEYNAVPRWFLLDLRQDREGSPFRAWPQARVVWLVEAARDAAARRLVAAMPGRKEIVERVVVGRGATPADKERRIRLIPLPSIGHVQTNRAVRRLLVMVPSGCPLRYEDIEWAFSGLTVESKGVGEALLVRADDLSMLRHYALESGESHRVWRSITPVVVPGEAARRRIDPAHRLEQAKTGSERLAEERRACATVVQALRHAGVRAGVESVRVQREPFSSRGLRAEEFAEGTRFAKERLWHVELRFAAPLEGPLVIGDGRYLGLGVLAPIREAVGVLAYDIEDGLASDVSAEKLARALRRAVMARVQNILGQGRSLPSFFTGHAADGTPLRDGGHRHLAFVAHPVRRRLLIVAPHILERRKPSRSERAHLGMLDEAMRDFYRLKAGDSGILHLVPVPVDLEKDHLLGRFQCWDSVTEYRPTRHAKRLAPAEALIADVLVEIARRGLPKPEVEVLSVGVGPRGGLTGRLRLLFHCVEAGPIILGRTSHLGGGVFAGCGHASWDDR